MGRADEKPDYGIDAPGIFRNRCLWGGGALVAGCLLIVSVGRIGVYAGCTLLLAGLYFWARAGLTILYAKRGKFRVRDRMLGSIGWRGDECVLDVGTGRGLLMIGAAKRLTTGKAIGIDIWSARDLSDNNRSNTLRNAALEGVSEKIELRNEDAQAMSFSDSRFDVVLSNLCLHNIPTAQGREKACREIARVLKPGGIALISDFRNTGDYAAAFVRAGCEREGSEAVRIQLIPSLRLLTIRKGPIPRRARDDQLGAPFAGQTG
jgi:SAM-dependent methyltransferase